MEKKEKRRSQSHLEEEAEQSVRHSSSDRVIHMERRRLQRLGFASAAAADEEKNEEDDDDDNGLPGQHARRRRRPHSHHSATEMTMDWIVLLLARGRLELV